MSDDEYEEKVAFLKSRDASAWMEKLTHADLVDNLWDRTRPSDLIGGGPRSSDEKMQLPDGKYLSDGKFIGVSLIRGKRKISQMALAKHLGKSQSFVSKLERGELDAQKEDIILMTELFRYPSPDIFLKEVFEATGHIRAAAKRRKVEVKTYTPSSKRFVPLHALHHDVPWAEQDDMVVAEPEKRTMIEAPTVLNDSPDAFCVKVPTNSMYPRFSKGEFVFCNPSDITMPVRGDYVVIEYIYSNKVTFFIRKIVEAERWHITDEEMLSRMNNPEDPYKYSYQTVRLDKTFGITDEKLFQDPDNEILRQPIVIGTYEMRQDSDAPLKCNMYPIIASYHGRHRAEIKSKD